MNIKRTYHILLLLAMVTATMAQNVNRLYVPAIKGIKGTTVTLPVCLENTSTDIVGMQWDINVPEGVTLQVGSVALDAERKADHVAVAEDHGGGRYTVLVYSPSNSAIKANNGEVVTIKASLSEQLQEEATYPVTLTNVALSNMTGNNLATAPTDGSITITHTPDFEISALQTMTSTVMPGGTLQARWKVTNVGEVASAGGWSERVSLVMTSGYEVHVTTLHPETTTLGAHQQNAREVEITLPERPGADGPCALKVEVVPDMESGESSTLRGNNMAVTAYNSVMVGKMLKLTLPRRLGEASDNVARGMLSRSGNRSKAETYNIIVEGDDRIEMPAKVTIEANASETAFQISISDNDLLDNDSLFTIRAGGNGYEETTANMVLVDDELPPLSVNVSKSDVMEGDTFTLSVTLTQAPVTPVAIILGDDAPGRLKYDKNLTMLAGTTSVETTVQAIDNDVIDPIQDVVIFARAEGYETGEGMLLLNDDDMPALSFSLSPATVSENAGDKAIIGVVKRTDLIDKKVTLAIADNSGGELTYPSSTIVMEKGVTEVQFSLGVRDNSIVDGERLYDVSATVHATSCDCPAQGEGKGVFVQRVTITDDDGPALDISSDAKTVLEGGNVTLVVKRNTAGDSSQPITVKLESDKDERLAYNHEVAFGAGETSKNVTVTANRNSVSGDDEVASFTATAEGYATGSIWMLITDQNLPDAQLGELLTANTSPEVGSTMTLTFDVKNVGNVPLPANTPISITIDGRNVAAAYTTQAIAAGDSLAMSCSMTAPTTTGRHVVQAEINARRDIRELLFVNNLSSPLEITVVSNFIVTVNANKERYGQCEEVVISGRVTGSRSSFADVDVYLINGGTRQVLRIQSDQQGQFSLTWKPEKRQTGHFIVGGCYPGEGSNAAMDEFDVVGLYSEEGHNTAMVGKTETYEGVIPIYNDGLLEQSNIHAVMKGEAVSGVFSFQPIAKIGAGEWAELHYTIEGTQLSPANEWEVMPIDIVSQEGASYQYSIYYYVMPLLGSLASETKEINTTVTIGTSRDYPLTIQNVGKGETGTITFSLPDWISPETPMEINSLKPGEAATVKLHINTHDGMELNLPIKGTLGINCTEGDGLAVPFTITPVSEQQGTLVIDVVDEYTFNTAEAPHLAGANVKVLMPSTGEVVAEGVTGEDGHFTASLSEGWYDVLVTAYKHGNSTGGVLVDPGRETVQQMFASYQNVTYNWDVVETEVEDEYQTELKADFETHVPKPYVTIEFPDERPTPGSIIPVTIENKGLINVTDVRVSAALSDGSKLVWLNDPNLDVLEPLKPKVFYAKVMPPASGAYKAKTTFFPCLMMATFVHYYQECGLFINEEYTESTKDFGSCNDLANILDELTEIIDELTDDKDKKDDPPIIPPIVGPKEIVITIDPPLPPLPPLPLRFCDFLINEKNNIAPSGASRTSALAKEEEGESICSTITLGLSQTAVMTRQAFRGTLTVNNGHEDDALKDFKVYLLVKDEKGNVATAHEFQIELEAIEGFTGEKALDAGWTLQGSGTGKAEILFVPTPYAAPDGPVEYSFGGSFSYTDPYNGLTVMHDLIPAKLTVNPTPRLDLTYFLQRDVISDNPLTLDVVEKAEPAEFALLINNKGNGDAVNMRMMAQRPQIVDNEKGLLLDFDLVGSQLNGGNVALAFGESATMDIGTIPAHGQAYLQWWLKSSLMGHFKNYEVSANHVTSYGNPDLSLLDSVSVHELIRSVAVTGTSHCAFLANDIDDNDNYPDMAYLTDGTVSEVAAATTVSVTRISEDKYLLLVGAASPGWVYGQVADPTGGQKQLVSITRNSDGAEVSLRNVWQTFVTMRDGKDPVQEYKLHVANLLEGTAESYTLSFVPVANTTLEVLEIAGTPDTGEMAGMLTSMTVRFNKAVDAQTFTAEDIVLTYNGTRLDNSLIGVNRVSEDHFVLDLSRLTDRYGYYVLTVNAQNVLDVDGFAGQNSTSTAWTQHDPASIVEHEEMLWKMETNGRSLFITSNIDMRLPVYTLDGRLFRVLDVHKGSSTFHDFRQGVYVIRNRKIVIGN